MSDVVVRVCVDQLTRFRIGVNRGKAEILDMIWPAILVEQYVPVRPAYGTVVEVVDHGPRVLFAESPVVDVVGLERIDSAFREQKVLAGEGLVHQPDVVEHLLATTPWL